MAPGHLLPLGPVCLALPPPPALKPADRGSQRQADQDSLETAQKESFAARGPQEQEKQAAETVERTPSSIERSGRRRSKSGTVARSHNMPKIPAMAVLQRVALLTAS